MKLTKGDEVTAIVARHDGRCLDRCGLRIHAGHDDIEPGHFGWRHVDCDRAQTEAWVRERMDAGLAVADVQLRLSYLGECTHLTAAQRMDASLYALDYADRLAATA